MMISIDANLFNADWTKSHSDLPQEGTPAYFRFLQGHHMTEAEFKKLPAYQLPKRREARESRGPIPCRCKACERVRNGE